MNALITIQNCRIDNSRKTIVQNINWTLESDNGYSDILDSNTSPKISQLETLLNKSGQKLVYNSETGRFEYVLDSARTDCLTGNITIPASVYNDSNSIELYERYALNSTTKFPNINLIFEGNNAKLYEIQILDGNNNIVWKRKLQNISIITEQTLSTSTCYIR